MSVEEFRRTLGLEDKYNEFAQMKRRVIEQARGELKERADIYFTYRVIREGRRAEALQFYIHENESVTEELKEEVSALESMPDTMIGRAEDNGSAEKSKDEMETESSSKEGPEIDAKRMFMEDLSQDELDSLSGDELDTIYEEACERAKRDNPNAASSVIAYETHTRMRKLWERR